MDKQQYECAKIEEIGTVTEGLSRRLQPLLIYHSVRKSGHVLELTCYKGDYYQCSQCRKLGKKRLIVVRQGSVVVSSKHPEDDHHDNCQPIKETGKFLSICILSSVWRL